MAKKRTSLFSASFLTGLLTGAILTAIGAVGYFKFISPSPFPPKNNYDWACHDRCMTASHECTANCPYNAMERVFCAQNCSRTFEFCMSDCRR